MTQSIFITGPNPYGFAIGSTQNVSDSIAVQALADVTLQGGWGRLASSVFGRTLAPSDNGAQAAAPTAAAPGSIQGPLNVWALAANGAALVYFQPLSGATGYVVTASNGATGQGQQSPILVQNLVNGTALTFTVSALMPFGALTSAGSNAVTPTAPPAGVSGLFAWYDMGQQPVVADTTALASLVDNSGNGWTINQATAGKRPVYRTAANWGGGATGKPAMQFNYSNNLTAVLQTPFTSRQLGVGFTIIALVSFTGLTNNSGARDNRLFSAENTRYDNQWYVGSSTGGLGGGGTTCAKVSNGYYGSNTTAPVVAINTPQVLSVVGGQNLFLGGVRASVASATGVLPELTQKYNGIQIGNVDDGNGQCAPVSFGEILFYNRQLSDAERWLVEAALAAKYGLAAPSKNSSLV